MELVDIHAHLEHEKFSHDLDEVIDSASKSHIKYVFTSGIQKKDYKKTLSISKKYSICKSSIGLNPVIAVKNNQSIQLFLDFIKNHHNDLAAIGEIGLDFYWMKNNEKEQEKIFRDILENIIDYDLPVILHTRSAFSKAYDIINDYEIKYIIWHCFGGSLSLAKKIIKDDMYISVPTSAVRNIRYQKYITELPLEHILTETDAPYQPIIPNTRNEPKNILELVKKIAELRNLDPETVSSTIFKTFRTIFKI